MTFLYIIISMNNTTPTLEFSKKNLVHNLIFNNISNDIINIYVKSSGYYQKEFFTAEYKFIIDVEKLIIKDIFFVSIMKHTDNSESEKLFDLEDFTENYFEHKIYNFIKNTLEKSIVTIEDNNLIVKITLLSIEYYLMIMTCNIENNLKNNQLNNQLNNELNNTNDKSTNEQLNENQEENNLLNNSSSNTTTSNKGNNNSSNEHSLTKTSDSSVSSDLESSEYAKTEPEILKLLMWGSIISFTSHLFQEKVNVKTKK